MKKLVLGLLGITSLQLFAQDPQLSSWITNDNGVTGNTYEARQLTGPQDRPDPDEKVVISNNRPYAIGLTETTDSANVTKVSYSNDYVYVWSTGVASYNMGPYIYDGNTNTHAKVDHVWKIPRNPQPETGTKSGRSAGNMAVFINGLPYYPPGDDMYYYDQQGVKLWARNAGILEADGFDCSGGHPAGEYYHYHRIPSVDVVSGIDTMCSCFPSEGLFNLDESKHSPLIGWGFDGYPIYGPYGYSDPMDENSSIRLIKSSYQERTYTNGKRTSFWNDQTQTDEAIADPSQYGPDVDATENGTTYPLGAFFEDYKYVDGSGDLNEYNVRFCKTPEFPEGTYAYFATVTDEWVPAYPYLMGEENFGVTEEDNFSSGQGGVLSGSVTVTETVESYFPMVSGIVTGSDASALLNAHPNPASQFTTVDLKEFMGSEVSITIVDQMGQIVQQESISGLNHQLHVLNVRELESGSYLLKVSNTSLSVVDQIIVK